MLLLYLNFIFLTTSWIAELFISHKNCFHWSKFSFLCTVVLIYVCNESGDIFSFFVLHTFLIHCRIFYIPSCIPLNHPKSLNGSSKFSQHYLWLLFWIRHYSTKYSMDGYSVFENIYSTFLTYLCIVSLSRPFELMHP